MSFSEFIVQHWQIISSLLLSIISIVLIILKKTKVISLPEGVIPFIIEMIGRAEEKFGAGHGEVKKDFVVDRVKSIYPSVSEEAIEKEIEVILSTPEKKGVNR